MKILSRYVLREFLIPLFYCMVGFLSIYVLFDLFASFSRIVEAKVSFDAVAMYFCGYLAPYFHYIVPAALMLATLYTMWSFCRHSEIVAMRASGVSFLAIVRPILSVALVMAAAVTWVNESFVPRKAQWAEQMKRAKFDESKFSRGDNIVFRNAKDCRTWNIDSFGSMDGDVLNDVRVTVDRPGGGRLMTVAAPRADWLDGQWWFSRPQVQHYDATGQEQATPTPELDALELRCFREFQERPSDFVMQNRPWKFNSVRDKLRYIRMHPEMSAEAKRDSMFDVWAQIMAPLACLVITLFAIPAGIASGRQSVFKGILGALAMYFAFYGLVIGGMVLAKNGWCPPVLAATLPHVVFLALWIRSFIRQQ